MLQGGPQGLVELLDMREGEPFGSLCTQLKRSELVVVINFLSHF